jgi:hypothetical protein
MREKIDVAIPAHNEEQLIARTLASIHEQQPGDYNFDVTVVANGCTDQTTETAVRAIESFKPRSDIGYNVVETPIADKTHALNTILTRSSTKIFMSTDADVTFSNNCFRRIAETVSMPDVHVSGAVPRPVIPQSLVGTLLGDIYRTRQLFRQISGKCYFPVGCMLAHKRETVPMLPANTGGCEDGYIIFSGVEQYGWPALQVAQDTSVYALSPGNWIDLFAQEARFLRVEANLRQLFPQFVAISEAGRLLRESEMPPLAERDERVTELLKKEGIPIDTIGLMRTINRALADNSEIMGAELVDAQGRWQPIASTKKPPL